MYVTPNFQVRAALHQADHIGIRIARRSARLSRSGPSSKGDVLTVLYARANVFAWSRGGTDNTSHALCARYLIRFTRHVLKEARLHLTKS
jgi:hypothetical protein